MQTTWVAVGGLSATLGAGVWVGVAVGWVVGGTGTLVGVALGGTGVLVAVTPGGSGVLVAGRVTVPLSATIWGLSPHCQR